MTAELAARAVRGRAAAQRGQLRVTAADREGVASALATLDDECADAVRSGYTGLRLAVDMRWATPPRRWWTWRPD